MIIEARMREVFEKIGEEIEHAGAQAACCRLVWC